MMHDDLHPDDLPERPRRPTDRKWPLADREVPLGPPSTTLSETVHAWLDGNATESAARRGGAAHHVEFWKRVESDLRRRRAQRTPAGLEARIMSAIPLHAPYSITPWYRRELVVTPYTAVLAMVTVMALAAAATALLLR